MSDLLWVWKSGKLIVCSLNGDYNLFYVDFSVGKVIGYGGMILYGVVVYNMIVYDIVKVVGDGYLNSLWEFLVKFVGFVRFGD